MKKSKKYMSEENFNLLVESLNQAIEYERGERNDLRVTIVPASRSVAPQPVESEMSIRDQVLNEVENMSESQLRQLADYIDFIRFQRLRKITPPLNAARIAALYGEFAEADLSLAEEGIADYTAELELEDIR